MIDDSRQASEDYLEYVRDQPCTICRAPADDPHHLTHRGSGGSDYTAIPLCRGHHREVHSNGLQQVERDYRVNLWRQAHRLLQRYLEQVDTPQ